MGYNVTLPAVPNYTITLSEVQAWPFATLNPFADYRAMGKIVETATAMSGVSYNDSMKALTLEPIYTPTNMVPAGKTIADIYNTTGDWQITDRGVFGVWLEAYQATADNAAAFESRYYLPEGAKLVARINRAKTWPAVAVTLGFGGGYRLVIYASKPPELFYETTLLSTMPATDINLPEFYQKEELQIEIACIAGRMHILIAGVTDGWIVPDIAVIPCGIIGAAVSGGSAMISFYAQRYQTHGTITETALDTQAERYPTPDAVMLYPPGAAELTDSSNPDTTNGRCWVRLQSVASGREVSMTWHLYGDGYHTPRLQARQVCFDGILVTGGSGKTLSIEGFLRDGEETIPEEIKDRTLALTLHDYQGILGKAFSAELWDQAGGAFISGAMRLTYRIGWTNAGGSVSDEPRGTLYARARREALTADGMQLYRIDCIDRQASWQERELWWAPCGQGLTLAEYLNLLLPYVGVDLTEIDWTQIGDTAYQVIDDPGCNYDSPAWLPSNGTNAGEYLQRLCDQFDIRLEFDLATELLVVRPRRVLRGAGFTYDTFAGTDPEYTMRTLDVERPLTGEAVKNIFVVVGRDGAGAPVYGQDVDWPALTEAGSDAYVGFAASQTATDDDITTPEHAAIIARRNRLLSTTGLRRLQMSGRFSLWYLLPRDWVLLETEYNSADGKSYRVTGVRNSLKPDGIAASAELVEIKAGTWE